MITPQLIRNEISFDDVQSFIRRWKNLLLVFAGIGGVTGTWFTLRSGTQEINQTTFAIRAEINPLLDLSDPVRLNQALSRAFLSPEFVANFAKSFLENLQSGVLLKSGLASEAEQNGIESLIKRAVAPFTDSTSSISKNTAFSNFLRRSVLTRDLNPKVRPEILFSSADFLILWSTVDGSSFQLLVRSPNSRLSTAIAALSADAYAAAVVHFNEHQRELLLKSLKSLGQLQVEQIQTALGMPVGKNNATIQDQFERLEKLTLDITNRFPQILASGCCERVIMRPTGVESFAESFSVLTILRAATIQRQSERAISMLVYLNSKKLISQREHDQLIAVVKEITDTVELTLNRETIRSRNVSLLTESKSGDQSPVQRVMDSTQQLPPTPSLFELVEEGGLIVVSSMEFDNRVGLMIFIGCMIGLLLAIGIGLVMDINRFRPRP
jgi:hypothetical protein